MLGNNRVQSRFFPTLVAIKEGVTPSHAVSVCGKSSLVLSIIVEAIDCTKPYNLCIVGSFTYYWSSASTKFCLIEYLLPVKQACIQALDCVTREFSAY